MTESGYSLSDIAAVSGGRNDGMFGGDWSAWIILFLLFGLFGNGNGFGFGGGFGGRGCAHFKPVPLFVNKFLMEVIIYVQH